MRTLASGMMLALRAIRDGGHITRAEQFWLRSEQYIDDKNTLTVKGHNELNIDDNAKGDKLK
jgi:hypothetical protein